MRACPDCGRDKRLHILEKAVAETRTGTAKVRIRLCRLKPIKRRQIAGSKKLRGTHVPDDKAYATQQKHVDKEIAKAKKKRKPIKPVTGVRTSKKLYPGETREVPAS